jgi:hypothetical protein
MAVGMGLRTAPGKAFTAEDAEVAEFFGIDSADFGLGFLAAVFADCTAAAFL